MSRGRDWIWGGVVQAQQLLPILIPMTSDSRCWERPESPGNSYQTAQKILNSFHSVSETSYVHWCRAFDFPWVVHASKPGSFCCSGCGRSWFPEAILQLIYASKIFLPQEQFSDVTVLPSMASSQRYFSWVLGCHFQISACVISSQPWLNQSQCFQVPTF